METVKVTRIGRELDSALRLAEFMSPALRDIADLIAKAPVFLGYRIVREADLQAVAARVNPKITAWNARALDPETIHVENIATVSLSRPSNDGEG